MGRGRHAFASSRSFARARSARSVLTPCPPLRICGEGGRKGSPEFPLSTSWRGGQGVRTERAERARAKDLLEHAWRMRAKGVAPKTGPSHLRESRSFAPAALRMTALAHLAEWSSIK